MALQFNATLRPRTGSLPVNSAFWPVFQICNFAVINICLYTVPPSVFGPLSRLPRELLLNTWLTFLLLSILLTWPIQFNRLILTNESISKYPNSNINSLYRFLLFSFTLIPPNFILKTFLSKSASRLAVSLFVFHYYLTEGQNWFCQIWSNSKFTVPNTENVRREV